MPKPLVSVLVPCCNVEKYVGQCLESICAQTLKEIEVICVNDGSRDGTLRILKEFAAKDPRIRLVDKPNTG
ncbi:MAG: glycosyltransferase family 2 protein, partial [Sutterellaceae bacterium]|nr:glycosyltransferase family 2 protein [Sutterellaceae bacterium]